MDSITFTKAKLESFKRNYEEAKEKGKTQFMFDGKVVLTAYAKYMIEYLKTKLH